MFHLVNMFLFLGQKTEGKAHFALVTHLKTLYHSIYVSLIMIYTAKKAHVFTHSDYLTKLQ